MQPGHDMTGEKPLPRASRNRRRGADFVYPDGSAVYGLSTKFFAIFSTDLVQTFCWPFREDM